MIKYICNACGRPTTDNKAFTMIIKKGFDEAEYKLCPTCAEALQKELMREGQIEAGDTE